MDEIDSKALAEAVKLLGCRHEYLIRHAIGCYLSASGLSSRLAALEAENKTLRGLLREYSGLRVLQVDPYYDDLRHRTLAALSGAGAEKVESHPDDLAVDQFAAAMKAKLAKKRVEGRGGWDDPNECSGAFLSLLLVDHVEKGDPLDVGNLAMMLHQRGDRIADERERYAEKVRRRTLASSSAGQEAKDVEPVGWQHRFRTGLNMDGEWGVWRYGRARMHEIQSYYQERPLYAAPIPAQQAVKELEWRQTPEGEWRAENYRIRCDIADEPPLWIVSGWSSVGTNPYETLKAAKAAAQADYNRRILAALVPAPQPVGEDK